MLKKSRINRMGNRAVLLAGITMLSSCGSEVYMPKPRGYFNIEVPEAEYQKIGMECPFEFEYSTHAKLENYNLNNEQKPCWFNIRYPRFNATIYTSYEKVNNNLKSFIDDSHQLAYKHVIKSSGIGEALVIDTISDVYGMIYDIEGDPASPYQLFLTDSARHFFRASLYFDFKPNYDSLSQVLKFLKADMDHIAETMEWK